jgi:hypothetical protein
MAAASVSALAEQLDVTPDRLAFLAGYADLSALEDAVAQALAADDDAIHQGLQHAVNLIPRPLRGRATKLLMPGGEV